VESVDEDGDIFFEEFLEILSADKKDDDEEDDTAAGLVNFFKDLSKGNIEGIDKGSNDLSFNNIIDTVRR